jgi:site-specific DNA-cytosine methylase
MWVMATGQANAEIMWGGCPTLNTTHEQPIYISTDKKDPSIAENGVGTTLAATEEDRSAVAHSIVRRLTPLECERLQGYPDGWTDIGDWVDSKGKLHKAADSPRYKALGNSIALPYWKVLLKKISTQYDRDATMASLFDGIGGFPLLWEQINGKGTALWASEIEEFPMAVTKIRLGED